MIELDVGGASLKAYSGVLRGTWADVYQSALLGREIARATGATLLVDGLVRRKATPSLGGLGRKARARVLDGAIEVNSRHRECLKGSNVLLVDDVLTSGATSGACVSALKRAGEKSVRIACFARVIDDAGLRVNKNARNIKLRASS